MDSECASSKLAGVLSTNGTQYSCDEAKPESCWGQSSVEEQEAGVVTLRWKTGPGRMAAAGAGESS